MIKLENLEPQQKIQGIVPNQAVTIVHVTWHGTDAINLFYQQADGQPGAQLLYRHDEARLELATAQRTWAFNADGATFRLVAEAYRIHLAHLFDPVLAVHTSEVRPLPHQITAVYNEMLTRQPLRYLLADDPGAGKTIMAGLLIKELMTRGDVRRCLICAPGGLAPQWQDELWLKFQTKFEIFGREMREASLTGNPFGEKDRLIVRLDQLARDDQLQESLRRTDWDLIIVDEAHKMSAHFWAGELEETKRYKLGKMLGEITRHFLLMTATPHNGKEEDFQLFLALLDQDRFEGRFRDGVHEVEISDLMRRMVKEDLYTFEGKRLFPERKAYTVSYPLSMGEKALYEAVSEYVRTEFDRAEKLGDSKRKGTVGFALTILQRRLASSPEAIYQSLKRRRAKLEKQLAATKAGQQAQAEPAHYYDDDYLSDLDDALAEEVETIEEEVLDSATAALTIFELQEEINTLSELIQMAYRVRHQAGDTTIQADRKWQEVASIIQDDARMIDQHGQRRKLVIFTEHRDTLNYLHEKISLLFGREETIVSIHGSVSRQERRVVEDRFRNDPDVHFLLATDAAGEGINLQRAHLMINYDLPWNPNRLEQRFGRIHRIGQNEVCHLWNLVAGETREGYVYQRLLSKIQTESDALQGKVFDVLGSLFDQDPLRKLLIEAIRYGDQPEVRAKLEQAVDQAVDQEHLRDLLEQQSLVAESMDISQIVRVREEMERYAARRLQPFYIKAFFLSTFTALGGTLREREPGRYHISYVPARIRQRSRAIETVVPVLERYERVCFDKAFINPSGQTRADFICPGHPLLDTVIDLMLDQHRALLRTGAILIDETDPDDQPRVLFFLEQKIQDARLDRTGKKHVISQEVHFVEMDQTSQIRAAGYAPYLDYRAATEAEMAALAPVLQADWLAEESLTQQVLSYAIDQLVPRHLLRVREQRETLLDKTLVAVQERLTKEINYWDGRAAELRRAERDGKVNARLNADLAQKRADDLAARLERRKAELTQERQISATAPVIVGGALVVPIGLLLGEQTPPDLLDKRITEQIAMQAVMQAETALGHYPQDISRENRGYDLVSLDPNSGQERYIEVKGRKAGAKTVTVTHNEMMTGFNSPERFILALVEIEEAQAQSVRYVREPFEREPTSIEHSVNFRLAELLARSTSPE